MPDLNMTLRQVVEQCGRYRQRKRLTSVIKQFAKFSGWQKDYGEIPMDLLDEKVKAFRKHLRDTYRSRNSFVKASTSIQFIFTTATLAGWKPNDNFSDEWRMLLKPAKRARCLCVLRYFAIRRFQVQEVTRKHIDDWVDEMTISRERAFNGALNEGIRFIAFLRSHKEASVHPTIAHTPSSYALPLDGQLKIEVKAMLDFRVHAQETSASKSPDDDEWGEDHDDYNNTIELSRGRPLSAPADLEQNICRFYGYQVKFGGYTDVDSLSKLFHPRAFDDYKRWLIAVRGADSTSVHRLFSKFFATANQYLPLASNRDAYSQILSSLKVEAIDEQQRRRRERACLHYKELEAIPGRIRKERLRIKWRIPSDKKGFYARERMDVATARLALMEFLIRWLLILPWTSLTLCGCRVSGPKRNLFHEKVEQDGSLNLPPWAAKQVSRNENRRLWQYHFDPSESSNGAHVHAVLPKCLIKPLNKYLPFREKLIGKLKTETLFVNRLGRPLDRATLQMLVNEITLVYAGKRLSPQAMRHIWAFEYLDYYPEDWDGLALQLWHMDPEQTKILYNVPG